MSVAYKGEDDSFPRELAICEYCFENDDALACLSDRCYECGRCSLDEQFSQTSDFAKPYAMASKCFYIQNVDVDDDGHFLGASGVHIEVDKTGTLGFFHDRIVGNIRRVGNDRLQCDFLAGPINFGYVYLHGDIAPVDLVQVVSCTGQL